MAYHARQLCPACRSDHRGDPVTEPHSCDLAEPPADTEAAEV